MKGRFVRQTQVSRFALQIRFRIVNILMVMPLLVSGVSQASFGQGSAIDDERVMLGVRFVGNTTLLAYIKPNGPAFKAGLKVGDELFSVNDDYVLQSSDLVRTLENNRPGDIVRLEVRRNGEYRFFNLEVMKATRDGQRVAADGSILPPPPEFGMVGEKAPSITVAAWQNLPDNVTRCQLTDFAGKVVVLMLFQSTCEFSRADGLPMMSEFYQRYKDDPDVQFLSVLASFPKHVDNTLENGVALCQRFNLPIPIGFDASESIDSTVCKELKALGSPWFVMVNRDGIVALNGMPEDIPDLDVIEKIKRGEKVMESGRASEMVPAGSSEVDGDDD